jgi:hypothetical protein
MTAPLGGARGACDEPIDVLTLDEESALKSIREIVGVIRANGLAVLVEDIEGAFVSIGGTVSTEKDEAGSKIYGLRGARFSLSADTGSGGAIQLSFLPVAR